MHIAEGVLSNSTGGVMILGLGMAAAAAGTAIGLRKMDYERIPQVALLSATFFVVSLIHVPCGPAAVHLVLVGLMGLVLGWAAFPALLVALGLQAVLFQFGGLTTLGLNTTIMALPAVVSYGLFHRLVHSDRDLLAFGAATAAGGFAILLAGLLTAGALVAAGSQFNTLGALVLGVHVPVAVVEGLITGSVVLFLRRVRPEILEAPLLSAPLEVFHG